MKYQDIQLSDVALKTQFVDNWLNGNYSQAFAVIDNNPQLDTKAFTADVLNLISAAIITLEQLYYTNVEDYLVQELQRYNVAINEFRQKQIWLSIVQYKVGNFVIYNDEIYLCIQNNVGQVPTAIAYWVYLGLKGLAGANSVGTQLKYQWNSITNYAPKDVVFFVDTMYVSKTNNLNKQPATNPNDWAIFLEIPKAKIIISQIPPTQEMLYSGLIWWKII